MSAKQLRRAAKLGIPLDARSSQEFEFDLVCPDGPWWGTHWCGVFDLQRQECRLWSAPKHPHVFQNKLCVHELPDEELITWVRALVTVWHITDWDEAFELRECVKAMITGLERQDCEPDLLAEFKFIKRALAHCGSDDRIDEYRQLIRDIQG